MAVSRVALVTGASSGFGQATATLLAGHSFQVFGTSHVPAPNPAGTYEMFPFDVCSETSVYTCVQTILQRTGRIDLLVNNAGYAQGGALEENSLDDVRAQFETNVFGVLRRWLPPQGFERVRRRVFQIQSVPAFDEKAEPVDEGTHSTKSLRKE
jgi:NADP-dependent 3-hydroxy acid dehydrogenase YdfG